MNLIIPNISWSTGERERLLGITIHPTENLLLTAGSDSSMTDGCVDDDVGYIKMWELNPSAQGLVKFIGSINQGGHSSTVNCIKFSYDGKRFASGSDDRSVKIWERRMKCKMGCTEQTLMWCDYQILVGHSREVYDIAWSRDGQILVSCGLDRNVIVWNVHKGKQIQTLDGHTSYVQGVVIDPRMKFIASLSQDRTARIWKAQKTNKKTIKNLNYYNAYVVKKYETTPVVTDGKSNGGGMFLGDSSFSFVRRPDWSPDASLFILPAAEYWVDDKAIPGAYLFLRQSPNIPSVFLPTQKPTVVVRFCKKLFKRDKEQPTMIDSPYKMVFAIATVDQVLIYTTQSNTPIAIFGNLHFAAITDMCFQGSNIIGICSSDGCCSFIKIDDNYFGEEYPIEELPEYIKDVMLPPTQVVPEAEDNKQQQAPVQPVEQSTYTKVDNEGNKKKYIIPQMTIQ